MKKIIASLFLLTSPLCFAEDTEKTSGFYTGLGISQWEDSIGRYSFSFNTIDLALGYNFFRYLGAEARIGLPITSNKQYSTGYTNSYLEYSEDYLSILEYPENTINTTEIDLGYHYALYLKPQLPLGAFNLYALLGYGDDNSKVSVTETINIDHPTLSLGNPYISQYTVDNNNSGAAYAAGINYVFTQNWSLALEMNRPHSKEKGYSLLASYKF